jgi:hypothetical protein
LKAKDWQYELLEEAIRTANFVRNKALRYWMDNRGVSKNDLQKLCGTLAKEYDWAGKLNSQARQSSADRAWNGISRFYKNCRESPMANNLITTTDPYLLAKKYARAGAHVRMTRIGGSWVPKCFFGTCPQCFKKLPGMLSADGQECCITRGCDYKREIYTESELKLLGRQVRSA